MGNLYLKSELVINNDPIIIGELNWGYTINKFDLVKEEIEKLKELGNDWDGYGAVAISVSIISTPLFYLCCLNDTNLDRISDVFANPHGTIMIEWEKNNEKLSLEIGQNNYSYFVKYHDKEPKLDKGEDIIADSAKIKTSLDEFFTI